MDPQIAAELAALRCEPRPEQELGGSKRTSREHHRPAGSKPVRARLCTGARHAVDSRCSALLPDDAVGLGVGPDPGPGRHGSRQVGDVHGPLRVEPATRGAGAALVAAACVSAQGLVTDAECLGSLEQELSVSSHPLGVDGAHVEHLLGLGVVALELAGPIDPVFGAPSGQHPVGGPKAGAGVDHGRASDGAPDRGGDRRAAFGDRQAPVAVKGRQRRERLLRIASVVHARAGLEHDDLQAGLRQHRRCHSAAGARPDDRHVALFTSRRRHHVT